MAGALALSTSVVGAALVTALAHSFLAGVATFAAVVFLSIKFRLIVPGPRKTTPVEEVLTPKEVSKPKGNLRKPVVIIPVILTVLLAIIIISSRIRYGNFIVPADVAANLSIDKCNQPFVSAFYSLHLVFVPLAYFLIALMTPMLLYSWFKDRQFFYPLACMGLVSLGPIVDFGGASEVFLTRMRFNLHCDTSFVTWQAGCSLVFVFLLTGTMVVSLRRIIVGKHDDKPKL
jgi:hypothetical protein